MNWTKGDSAMIIQSMHPERIGLHVTIMSELVSRSPQTGQLYSVPHHLIDLHCIRHPHLMAAYKPHALAPIPDKYNGLTITTWDECDWTPKELERVEG